MELYFVRHGETVMNREKRLLSRTDVPLSPKGREEAGAVRDFLLKHDISFDCVLSSPMLRTLETAQILAGNLTDIRKDIRLLEMDYGPYEGIRLDDPPPEITYFFRDFIHHPAPEGMESLDEVKARMQSFLEDAKREAAKRMLIVTHAISLKGALEVLTPGADGARWSRYIHTCAVFRTAYRDGAFGVPEEIFTLQRMHEE